MQNYRSVVYLPEAHGKPWGRVHLRTLCEHTRSCVSRLTFHDIGQLLPYRRSRGRCAPRPRARTMMWITGTDWRTARSLDHPLSWPNCRVRR